LALKDLLSLLGTKSAKSDKKFALWIKSITGYSPKNLTLYVQAFNHSSILNKQLNFKISNERLEFLGDAILGAVVAEYLFNIFPLKDEGFLTQLRSKIVNGQSLRELSVKLGFNTHLKANLTKEEKLKSSAFGDAFEAFVGAVYLDLGYIKTKNFVVKKVINLHLDIDSLIKTNEDYKSQLQIYCQKNKLSLEYKLISEEKKGTHKLFIVQVIIDEKPYIRFESYSKRLAEQKAAQLSLAEIQKTIG
jgi:ribonuclease-3